MVHLLARDLGRLTRLLAGWIAPNELYPTSYLWQATGGRRGVNRYRDADLTRSVSKRQIRAT